jgi:hypothetical protein
MKRFQLYQRVKIVWQDGLVERQTLIGKTGKVVRCRHGDNGAWVQMDEPLTEKLASFPEGDPRRKHILMYPEECEPANLQSESDMERARR